jgi:hypothetical protein
VKAPAAGTIDTKLAANAKVAANDTVAQIKRDPMLVATFAKAENATADAPVLLAVKGTEQKLACTVVQAAPEGTKIACPKDAASEGAEVTYAGLDASRQAAPANEAGSAAAGSADAAGDTAGSADATGSAAPAAGSDAEDATEKAVEKPAEKKAPRPARPRPAPKADKPDEETEAPAEKPAETPPPAPTPAPSE